MQHSRETEAAEELERILNNQNLKWYWMDAEGNIEEVDREAYERYTLFNQLFLMRDMSYYGQDFILGSDILYESEFQEKLDNWMKIK